MFGIYYWGKYINTFIVLNKSDYVIMFIFINWTLKSVYQFMFNVSEFTWFLNILKMEKTRMSDVFTDFILHILSHLELF